jgi:hypothetical protein
MPELSGMNFYEVHPSSSEDLVVLPNLDAHGDAINFA